VQAHAGEQGRLYGSVTSADIAQELSRAVGKTVDKRDIDLDEPIRSTGAHKVKVHVAPKLTATLTVEVVGDKQ
jgi:large subunit ribosomal protein L9